MIKSAPLNFSLCFHLGTEADLSIMEDAVSSILNNLAALGASRQLSLTGINLN
jgi:hypothetical protein